MSKKQPDEHKKLLLIALENSMGIVTTACKEVGISRDRFYAYYKTDENFRQSINDINDIQLDFVESQLLKNIAKGDRASIMFYMKHKGKKRGYTDSVDITTNGKSLDTNIRVIFIDGNKSDTSPEKDD